MTKTQKRYDVVIYEYQTGIIDSIVGTDMPMRVRKGSYSQSAEKRIETVLPRLNDRFGAKAVLAGKYQKGDRITT